MKYTIYAEDGSFIETILKGEAMDTGDKAINKAMAIAYKYLCFQLFCIPVEDMTDPDSESPELGAEKQKKDDTPKGKASDAKKTGKKTESQKAKKEEPSGERKESQDDDKEGKICLKSAEKPAHNPAVMNPGKSGVNISPRDANGLFVFIYH